MGVRLDYIAAGGNRHPSAADWNAGVLAYGSGNNIALWTPQSPNRDGVSALLTGHTDVVNAVRLFEDQKTGNTVLISASADHSIRFWISASSSTKFSEVKSLVEHTASINVLAVLPEEGLLISGAADATVKVWKFCLSSSSVDVELIQSISMTPRFFPLALAVTKLSDDQVVFAVAGTTTSLRVFIRQNDKFVQGATLTGHEGWIRSLDFVCENPTKADSDYLLASASQDKYVRLWRFHQGEELPAASAAANDPALGGMGRSLSNKAHYIGSEGSKHSITFEALLIGHEDWIYTARWFLDQGAPQLLTASADNSLAIWERDPGSGYWQCTTRLGEISAQKGSTSATGSTGGFWIGLWSSDGRTVTSLGRTGSWRQWAYSSAEDRWIQQVGISGHVKHVKDVTWTRDGSYLISTSSDQTTRLYGEWKRNNVQTWHEIARPQIHGYDLNCLDAVGQTQFISGADEKLLRVFNKPRAVAKLISKLRGGPDDVSSSDLPEAANIPVLGLSNKAVSAATTEEEAAEAAAAHGPDDRDAVDPSTVIHRSTLDLAQPPFEDHLARHTLWPEHEKLYGHGYEISAVAASHDGTVVATACRASSLDHAVIRLYDTKEWHQIKPPLAAHTLTVTSLSFSPDDKYLLSVGRDRQWALFQRESQDEKQYKLLTSNPKGHSRMILNCSWAPESAGPVFATAGRDKSVKIWQVEDGKAECKVTLPTSASATAVAFLPHGASELVTLAYGTEEGAIYVAVVKPKNWTTTSVQEFDKESKPSAAVNALRWRPVVEGQEEGQAQLAVASDDHSVRLFSISTVAV